jgi:ATP-binding cassette subfamily B multidrug efflux pump
MKEAFRHLGWFFKQQWKKYVLCAITLLFVSILPIVPARVLGLAIDSIALGTLTTKNLMNYCFLLFFVPLFVYLVQIVFSCTMSYLGHELSFRLREQYLSHLFDMDASLFEKYTKGDLIARCSNDLNSLTILATSFLQSVVYYVALILASITMMITIHPLLTLASVLFMPFAITYLNKKRKKKREYYKIHHEIYGNMTESVLESIESAKVVRAYGQEEFDYQRTKVAIDADVNSWWKILKFESLFTPLFELVYAISYFVAIGLGSYFVVQGSLSPGNLISFLLYVGMLYGPLIGLSNILNNVSNITIADTRFYEIMSITSEVKVEEEKPILHFQQIDFKDVSFQYPFDRFSVLNHINLTIHSGETIGIVGPTGSGKSTLIRQLLRQFNITSGEILIDGVSLNHFAIEDVRNLVGYVPQENILFRKTVDENILIGNPSATPIDLNQAMTVADFKKDLRLLPQGEATQVSEAGSSLSGGQRQRLSIARALVKNPEILILDDSLSAVDALTESNIIHSLKETRVGKTNIIIAHRFSAIAKADKIIVMQHGQITDIGSHKELLSYDNWYKMQYLNQIRGDIHEEL